MQGEAAKYHEHSPAKLQCRKAREEQAGRVSEVRERKESEREQAQERTEGASVVQAARKWKAWIGSDWAPIGPYGACYDK
jgi:hypothetical protein